MKRAISPYAWPGICRPDVVRHRITTEEITAAVCGYYRVKPEFLSQRNRQMRIVRARHVIWLLIRRFIDTSTLKEMGMMFKKDHTTVIHGLQAIADHMETEPELRRQIEQIAKKLKSGIEVQAN